MWRYIRYFHLEYRPIYCLRGDISAHISQRWYLIKFCTYHIVLNKMSVSWLIYQYIDWDLKQCPCIHIYLYNAIQTTHQLCCYPLNLFLVLLIKGWVSVEVIYYIGFNFIPLYDTNTCLIKRPLIRASAKILFPSEEINCNDSIFLQLLYSIVPQTYMWISHYMF